MAESITTRLRKSASSNEAWKDPEKRRARLEGQERARQRRVLQRAATRHREELFED